MSTPAAQARDALRAGRQAAEQRKTADTNPYRGNAPTARERVLARMWTLGYSGGNPMTVDYSG